MVRRLVGLAAAASLAMGAVEARAEGAKDETIPGFGLGVGIGLGNAYTGGTPATPPVSLYATFNLGDRWRLEPNLGFWYVGKGASAASALVGAEPGGGYAVQLGLGGFYVLRPVHPLAIYGGARFGVIFDGATATLGNASVSTSEVDLYLGPALGVEWSVARPLSIGAEAQMPLRWYLDPVVHAGDQNVTVSRSKFGIGLEALIFVRIYL